MKSILDPSFHYIKSVDTDLRKTFARVRRELRNRRHITGAGEVEASKNVLSIRRVRQ